MYRSFNHFLEDRRYWGSQGAGVLLMDTESKKWLVALRSAIVKEPHTWSAIGGKIDPDDSNPQMAAKREFYEETGYSGPMKLMKAFVFKSPEKSPDTGMPVFTYHNFIGEIHKGAWEPEVNEETDKFAWVTYEELLNLQPKHYGLKALIRNSGDIIRDLSEKPR